MPPSRESIQPGIYKLGSRIYRVIQLVVTGVLLFALLYGWHWLSDPTQFPIRSVKIQAAYTHVGQQTLQQLILPYVGGGFIRFETGKLKQQLLTLPWIAEVDIQRVWPDAVVIKVTEQQAVASWGKQGLVNSNGQVFSPPADSAPPDLPILNGPVGQAAPLWANYQAITQMLQPLGLSVRELDMDERLSLQLALANGTRLLLGKTDPLPRLQRFVKVYPKIFTTPEAQADYVDLRYENGLSVKWRDSHLSPTEKP